MILVFLFCPHKLTGKLRRTLLKKKRRKSISISSALHGFCDLLFTIALRENQWTKYLGETIPTHSPSHTLPLCQSPQRKELLAVTEHSVMMDVVTLYITKDHPSQLTGFVRNGSRMHSMKFRNNSTHRNSFTVKSLCTLTSDANLCLVINDHMKIICRQTCSYIPVFLCVCDPVWVCLWTVSTDQNAEWGSTLSAHWGSRNSCQNAARLLFWLWM